MAIQFTTALTPWIEIRALLRTASAKSDAEIQAPALLVDRNEDRRRVSLQVRAISIEQGAPPDGITLEAAVAVCTDTVAELGRTTAMPNVAEISSSVGFFQPKAIPFHQLLDEFKTKFTRGDAFREATDLGLVASFDSGGIRRALQFGPMQREQLKSDYNHWADEDELPAVSLFVSATHRLTELDEEFDPDRISSALAEAAAWQTEAADSIVTALS